MSESTVRRAVIGMDGGKPDGCTAEPGTWRVLVNLQRCEGKGDCARVCPYDIFELQAPTPEEKAGMSLGHRLKLWVHGGKVARMAKPELCRACGLCVHVCPEQALRLDPLT